MNYNFGLVTNCELCELSLEHCPQSVYTHYEELLS